MISTVCVVSSAKERTTEMTHSLVKKETTTENYDDTTSSNLILHMYTNNTFTTDPYSDKYETRR